MSPVELSPALQTTATSTTLWAQPSKEWVIPAKPKPGRKPKKETSPVAIVHKNDQEEIPSGSRRVQNRAAQRAFRERKQTQLVELQARLHSYEQGEIERNVALQNIAKRVKDENEELRKENQMLKEKIAWLERERDELCDKDRKRTYDDTSMSSLGVPLTDNSTTKRARVEAMQAAPLPPLAFSTPVSSPDDALPASGACSGEHETRHHVFHPSPLFTTTDKTAGTMEDIVESFNCILCSPDAPCICRQVTAGRAATSDHGKHHRLPLQNEDLDQRSMISSKQSVQYSIPEIASGNILDSLPVFQAPVPIRRKAGTSRANVFPVMPITTASSSLVPKCSGDPDNCVACADDNFGKAFCQAIGHTLNSSQPCVDCPDQTNETVLGRCCGDVGNCGSCGIAPIVSSPSPSRRPETIPTDDAWRQLKSHPNVAFADLSLLAEVVARRSKCTGSRVVISPALESATLDGGALPSHHDSISAEECRSILVTEPQVELRRKQRQWESPPQLVPQHVLIECGRRRMREVNADGVREALRLLDQKFAHIR